VLSIDDLFMGVKLGLLSHTDTRQLNSEEDTLI
jgi:hypothetical protein